MADIDFPQQFLRSPLKASIRRDIATGFVQSSPASGTPYNRRTTFDNPVIFDIEFAIEGGKKALFYAWLYSDDALVGGIKPFNIDLEVEGAYETQEAWFTEGGVPQLAKEENQVWFYSAQIRLRKLNNPWEQQYQFLLDAAADSPGGDPLSGLSIFDIAVNEDWPEA
jgi:hypothetical protein